MSITRFGYCVGQKFEKPLHYMSPSEFNYKIYNGDIVEQVKVGDLVKKYFFDTYEEALEFLCNNLPKYKYLYIFCNCVDFGGGISFSKCYKYVYRG